MVWSQHEHEVRVRGSEVLVSTLSLFEKQLLLGNQHLTMLAAYMKQTNKQTNPEKQCAKTQGVHGDLCNSIFHTLRGNLLLTTLFSNF